MTSQVLVLARAAKQVAPIVATLTTPEKNAVLHAVADSLIARQEEIIAANARDVAAGRAAGMGESLVDRLLLDEARIAGIADGTRQVATLADPVGEVLRGRTMDNGITMKQVRVPLGVMGMVYEARPNVTVDAFALALKSGNVALLRGSKSAAESNTALVRIMQDVVEKHGLPREVVQLLPSESHDSVQDLITARGFVDVVIPRGSAALINAVVENATVPTIETGTGNCHVYVDASADVAMATKIVINGKVRRPSVCNATETLLLDAALPLSSQYSIVSALQSKGVTIHGDVQQLSAFSRVVPATEEDWAEEYLSMDIAVALVDGLSGAIEHIREYSSGHTEAVVASDYEVCRTFAQEVDAAAVMINASTAFTDGEQYGMGAEIGISTQKLHARGPMALPELTSTKWILEGTGQTRP
ncbi:glutamate-5-semialdehyde dehydrogenase [Corynebacterium renale]|uniref:Gamma-glutamyl phosphate reductase n=1 Tax=Corynebacterium renale TaxID=1724 RepID=A0A2A9DPC3_9CORY|nr:glutamate-5-semialdehyde dehydrogenase [Corynebacterium renale]PFG28231.1 glutamate-5-semialdehyde dehydrogenase [Corynebacterium renale]SQI19666.1 gamma-glutamyl phosphate reductase [Corynebacterium renale]